MFLKTCLSIGAITWDSREKWKRLGGMVASTLVMKEMGRCMGKAPLPGWMVADTLDYFRMGYDTDMELTLGQMEVNIEVNG
tara:strand:- start:1 stop:243 length:243 start_codon:yes stop_codon:yes gene_type:complete